MEKEIRLNKILSLAGIASRRKSDQLIQEGRVAVDGKVVKEPFRSFAIDSHSFSCYGKTLSFHKSQYLILYKPKGYLCSNRRIGKEKLAIDLIDSSYGRVYTAGRLDKESEGLIILTNDGDFANRVTHPKYNVQKEYLVKTDQFLTHEHLKTLSAGTMIEGSFVKPYRVKKVRKNSCLITVKEGKKHEVRLLVAAAGLTVLQLKRTRIGSLHLGKLQCGTFRPLTLSERKLFDDSSAPL